MSNRCYLYSTNYIPGDDIPLADRTWSAIAGFVYDVPYVAKILTSANPRTCNSDLFDDAEGCAIIADYAGGAERLLTFLDQVQAIGIDKFRREARDVLEAENRRNRYLLLEPLEVFDSVDNQAANRILLAELKDSRLLLEMAQRFLQLPATGPEPPSQFKALTFWDRLLGRQPALEAPVRQKSGPAPDQIFYDFGLGCWETVLFADLPGTDRCAPDS